MIRLNASTAEEAVKQVQTLRTYKPYQYGGRWFVGAWGGEGFAYRSKRGLVDAARRGGQESISMIVLESRK